MNYQAIIYFKTVAELQHYTHAADALYITQPALSKAIRNLEKELGVRLFQKDGRNVVLTEPGRMFYRYVKSSVDEMNKGVAALKHFAAAENNTVFLSVLQSMYANYLPDQIMRFRKAYPGVLFALEYKSTSPTLEDVLQERCDLGICCNFNRVDRFAHLDAYTLYQDPISLIVNKEHPFAHRSRVSIDELRGEPFIVHTKSKIGLNSVLDALCAPRGFAINAVTEAYTDFGVIGLVSAGEGIGVIPVRSIQGIDSVVQVQLELEQPLVRDIMLVWRGNQRLPKLAAAFRDALIEHHDQAEKNS